MDHIDILSLIRHLAFHIPCGLCVLKGNNNIKKDGGCRHRSQDFNTAIFDGFIIEKLTDFVINNSSIKLTCHKSMLDKLYNKSESLNCEYTGTDHE